MAMETVPKSLGPNMEARTNVTKAKIAFSPLFIRYDHSTAPRKVRCGTGISFPESTISLALTLIFISLTGHRTGPGSITILTVGCSGSAGREKPCGLS